MSTTNSFLFVFQRSIKLMKAIFIVNIGTEMMELSECIWSFVLTFVSFKTLVINFFSWYEKFQSDILVIVISRKRAFSMKWVDEGYKKKDQCLVMACFRGTANSCVLNGLSSVQDSLGYCGLFFDRWQKIVTDLSLRREKEFCKFDKLLTCRIQILWHLWKWWSIWERGLDLMDRSLSRCIF